VDGALVDNFKLPHGYWEAKDTKDDLDREIQKKFDTGYPKDNILFQAPHRAIIYNNFLTLEGIPPEVFAYKLGNRSALEWVIDQYKVSIDRRSGITNDPNRDDDPQYIVRLIGQVITVSLETLAIIQALRGLE
jgi:predicted helicase